MAGLDDPNDLYNFNVSKIKLGREQDAQKGTWIQGGSNQGLITQMYDRQASPSSSQGLQPEQ